MEARLYRNWLREAVVLAVLPGLVLSLLPPAAAQGGAGSGKSAVRKPVPAAAPGQGGVPNAYWICEPDTVIKPGIYMVTDSDTSTWSQNPETRGAGITEISGVYQN